MRLFLHVRVMHTVQTQLAFYVYVMSELLEAHISRANTQTAPDIALTSFVGPILMNESHIKAATCTTFCMLHLFALICVPLSPTHS